MHGYGKRFIVRADEKLTAFVEFEAAIRACGAIVLNKQLRFFQTRHRLTDLNQAEALFPR